MNAARWAAERRRREALAALDPVRGMRIVRRVVVIDHEREVREAVLYDGDSAREARRKLRGVLSPRATKDNQIIRKPA